MHSKITISGLKVFTSKGRQDFKPRQTKILESYDCGSHIVIKEDYSGYQGSNVYAIDENLTILWYADLPHPSDSFANMLIDNNSDFITSTWNGIKCSIDIISGKTTKIGITK